MFSEDFLTLQKFEAEYRKRRKVFQTLQNHCSHLYGTRQSTKNKNQRFAKVRILTSAGLTKYPRLQIVTHLLKQVCFEVKGIFLR